MSEAGVGILGSLAPPLAPHISHRYTSTMIGQLAPRSTAGARPFSGSTGYGATVSQCSSLTHYHCYSTISRIRPVKRSVATQPHTEQNIRRKYVNSCKRIPPKTSVSRLATVQQRKEPTDPRETSNPPRGPPQNIKRRTITILQIYPCQRNGMERGNGDQEYSSNSTRSLENLAAPCPENQKVAGE